MKIKTLFLCLVCSCVLFISGCQPPSPPAAADVTRPPQTPVPVKPVMVLNPTLPVAASTPTPQPEEPFLCQTGSHEIYLVFDAAHHLIADSETFLNLGFEQTPTLACEASTAYAQSAPLTRLLKGTRNEVYWLENGLRRHIPNMDTFYALGYRVQDIAVLPDELLATWPLGDPLPPQTLSTVTPAAAAQAPAMPETTTASGDYEHYQEVTIGDYIIRLWRPIPGTGMYDKASISAAGQADVWVESVQAIGKLPVADITGDGYPEVMFETHAGGSHCCWGTVVYSLGPSPVKVLDINSAAYYSDNTGRGAFQDMDGNGRYEFIARDPLTHIACSGPDVKIILEYEPGQGYVGASYRFPALYVDDIALYTQRAEQNIELSKSGYTCDVYPVVVSYLYAGQHDKAWAEFERLYLGPDADELRQNLTQAVQEGRFFAKTP